MSGIRLGPFLMRPDEIVRDLKRLLCKHVLSATLAGMTLLLDSKHIHDDLQLSKFGHGNKVDLQLVLSQPQCETCHDTILPCTRPLLCSLCDYVIYCSDHCFSRNMEAHRRHCQRPPKHQVEIQGPGKRSFKWQVPADTTVKMLCTEMAKRIGAELDLIVLLNPDTLMVLKDDVRMGCLTGDLVVSLEAIWRFYHKAALAADLYRVSFQVGTGVSSPAEGVSCFPTSCHFTTSSHRRAQSAPACGFGATCAWPAHIQMPESNSPLKT